jgi:hypothetical protein
MKHKSRRGVSIIEFTFIQLVLVPLFLGTAVIGINMVQTLVNVQLARDAGHMWARGVDFGQVGNKKLLEAVGSGVGLSATSGSGNAVVILSVVTYIDKGMCASDGKVDGSGNPSGCTNYQKWVFTQRVVIGNSGVRTSNFGTPPSGILDSAGKVSLDSQVTNAADVAYFVGINPYSNVNNTVAGLPSGQVIYLAESAANGFSMTPFLPNAKMYSFDMF